ncbi:hypothetical protein EDD21DRAFT_20127 [Dissophora ornata]|nr:hypothetical protein EDD21DRAFT_20127 [Dissophora ornata]
MIRYKDVENLLYRQRLKEAAKDNNIITSVRLWIEEIKMKGGKGNIWEDGDVKSYIVAWCTSFQLKIMQRNDVIACMDSTHGVIKSLMPDKTRKVRNGTAMFTILVKDLILQKGIPIAHMTCSTESTNGCVGSRTSAILECSSSWWTVRQ